MTILLHRLPVCHSLRNKPLGEIRAEARNVSSKTWRPVAAWKIGSNTFNELGPTWTSNNEFRIVVETLFVSNIPPSI